MRPGNIPSWSWLLSLMSDTYLELSFYLMVDGAICFWVESVITVAVVEVRAAYFFFMRDLDVTAE